MYSGRGPATGSKSHPAHPECLFTQEIHKCAEPRTQPPPRQKSAAAGQELMPKKGRNVGSGRAVGLGAALPLFPGTLRQAECSLFCNVVKKQGREGVSQKCEGCYNIQEYRRIRGGPKTKTKPAKSETN